MSFSDMSSLILNFILCFCLFSSPKSPEDFRWQKRIIISFDPNGFDEDFLSTYQSEIKDRKLLLVHLGDQEILWTNSTDALEAEAFMEFRNRIRSASSWALVGLDGGIKSQGSNELPLEELFRLIDSMPMRQSEIRRKTGKDGI